MHVEMINITPGIASEMLELTNKQNRSISSRNVSRLAREMREGRWKVNGDAIRFSNDGILIDGQHRLLAIVESGVTVSCLVVRGLEKNVFDSIDIGKRRSAADTLSISGEVNCTKLAACLKMIDKYKTCRVEESVEYSNSEIEQLLCMYPNARTAIHTGKSEKCKGLISPSVFNSCYYLFREKDETLAKEFINKLIEGNDLPKDDPIFVLRERLLYNMSAKGKLSNTYIMAICIKAWNYKRKGLRVKCLKWAEVGNREKFPVIE